MIGQNGLGATPSHRRRHPKGVRVIASRNGARPPDDGSPSEAYIQAYDSSCPNVFGDDSYNTAKRTSLKIGSDVEIAKLVAKDLQEKFAEVIFTDGDYYCYTGGCWRSLDWMQLRRAVHLYDGARYLSPARKPANVRLNKARVDSVLHEMRAIVFQPDFFAEVPIGINCASGFIIFENTGQPRLVPHDPKHRCRHILPGCWQENTAHAEPPADSLLGRLLAGVFKGDSEEIQKRALLEEIAGATATGGATKLRQPKAVILKGEIAENGKSQVLDVMRGLLPQEAISSITAAKMGDERHVVHLAGKLLNASDELSGSAAISSEVFKAVVTGEPVSGRDVYSSMKDFRPIAQHIFATNILPTFTNGMDRGVQRRLLVLIFNRFIPLGDRIEHIGRRIGKEEPDLLLALAVRGAARLIQQRGFTIPPSSETALRQWIYGTDPVLAWVQARVAAAPPAGAGQRIQGIKSRDAYSMFREWALQEGFRANTIPAVPGFVQRLQANKVVPSITVKHGRTGNLLTGLTILTTDRDTADDEEGDTRT